jgi:hypothetical protein
VRYLVLLVLLLTFAAGFAFAEEWVGWLRCADADKAASEGHQKCVEGGQPAVFVTEADQKEYKIDSLEKVKPHIGKKVRLKGSLEDGLIKVEEVVSAE